MLMATERAQRVRAAAVRHHGAMATWQGGVSAFGVLIRRERADAAGFISEAVTAVQYTVSLCVADCPGIAEGSTDLQVNGRPCRITGPVVPDAGGWATFPVVFEEEADHAAP